MYILKVYKYNIFSKIKTFRTICSECYLVFCFPFCYLTKLARGSTGLREVELNC